MQNHEYDPILESGFSHVHNQSSVKTLIDSGKGNCFAYAKYRLYAEPWLSLYVDYNTGIGLHFGVVESNNGLLLHHLTSKVKLHPLYVSESVQDRVNSGQTIIKASRMSNGAIDLNKDNKRVSAVFYNTFEWSGIFKLLHNNINPNRPWSSVLAALDTASTDII